MKNVDLLRRSTDFNAFTAELLRRLCEDDGIVIVRCRSGEVKEIVKYIENTDEFDGGFWTHSCRMGWNNDGSSFQNSDYDLIEILC